MLSLKYILIFLLFLVKIFPNDKFSVISLVTKTLHQTNVIKTWQYLRNLMFLWRINHLVCGAQKLTYTSLTLRTQPTYDPRREKC